MADIRESLKCSKCGYMLKEYGICPRCGTVVQCSMSCSGNCLKCSEAAIKRKGGFEPKKD